MMTVKGRRPLLRTLAALWGALQLVLPLAVTFADAQSEAAGVRTQIHVEATPSASCVPVHGDDCALCRFLSAPSGQPVARAAAVWTACRIVAPRDAKRGRSLRAPRELPPSRAPPQG